MRTPYILETSASYLVRSAVTGAQFGIDQTGNVIFNDGEGSRFFMSADVVGMSTADGSESIQMLAKEKQVVLTAGETTSFLFDKSASQFTSTGTLSIGTAGLIALGHAVTLEQVINLFINFIYFLDQAGDPSKFHNAGKILDPASFPGGLIAALTTWITGAINPALPTAATPGGNVSIFIPAIFGPAGAITAGVSVPSDPLGLLPGIGRSGFMY